MKNIKIFKKMNKYKKQLSKLIIISMIIINVHTFASVPEELTRGVIYYNDRGYIKANVSYEKNKKLFSALKTFKDKFKNASISYIPVPQSQIELEGEEFGLVNQNEIIKKLEGFAKEIIGDDLNFVNAYDEIFNHRDEYLYFWYDNHWTNRGAYYAYKVFCENKKIPVSIIDSYKELLLSTTYKGSDFTYTKDIRFDGKLDYVYAYVASVSDVLEIKDNDDTLVLKSNVINRKSKTYGAFMGGDHPYEVVTIEENDPNKCAIVIKDSFGNAFVPYLVSNYGKIFVVDPRFADFDLMERISGYNIVDIIAVFAIFATPNDDVNNNIKNLIDWKPKRATPSIDIDDKK